jgi:glutamate--cysteine ligase
MLFRKGSCWQPIPDFSFFALILSSDSPVGSLEDIFRLYSASFCPPDAPLKIGVEWERFGIFSDTNTPVPYLGDRGYEKIIQGLSAQFGWKAEDEQDGHIFTLVRGKTRITTEGDGKPEISGAPSASLNEVQNELSAIDQEIQTFASPMKIEWFPLGLHPFHSVSEIPLAPKNRYQTFLKMFSKNEEWMSRFMKSVCGLHINIDAYSAKDLMKKAKTLFRLSPVLCGAFANSPLENGKPTGLLCTRRARIFSGSGMGREVLPGEDEMLSSSFSFEQWIERFLEREMIILSRKKGLITIPNGTTFLDFLSDGIAGEIPTFADVDAHIKTHWVDIRPRIGYLEFRSLDALPLAEAMAVTAFVKGILLSDEAMDAVQELTKQWKEEDFAHIHEQAWKYGIRGKQQNIPFVAVLQELMPIAEKNLNTTTDHNEHEFLDKMKYIVENKKTPAEEFLEERGFL